MAKKPKKKQHPVPKHKKKAKKPGRFPCTNCNGHFDTAQALGGHRRHCTGVPKRTKAIPRTRRFPCPHCGKTYTTEAGRNIHVARWCERKPDIKVTIPGLRKDSEARGEAMLDTEPANLICGHCNQHFGTLAELEAHDVLYCAEKYQKDPTEPDDFHCKHCGMEFPSVMSRDAHQSRCLSASAHPLFIPRNCETCGWWLENYEAYRTHVCRPPVGARRQVPDLIRERVLRYTYQIAIKVAIMEEAPSFDRDAIQDIIDKVEAMVDEVMKED